MGNPLDQPQILQVEIKDNNPYSPTYGTLQDPGALSLIVQPPDEAAVTYTYANGQINRASQGVYYFVVPAGVAGNWSYRWVATGAFAGATDQLFFVVDSSTIG